MVHISAGGYDYVTSYEIQLIETCLSGSQKLINSSKALNILKMFNPFEVENKNSPNGYYFASDKTEDVFNHYYQIKTKFFQKRKINSYIELVTEARDYCEKYMLIEA